MSLGPEHGSILEAVGRYYDATFAEHGTTARGVDWSSAESQATRFEQLATLFAHERTAFSVNDLGCGYGAFATFLLEHGYAGSYTGYDVSAAMIDHARAQFRDQAHVEFVEGTDLAPADYSVASGIFNVKLQFSDEEWATYVIETIDRLARASRKGFSFNMLTSYSDADRKRADLYYADPRDLFDTCAHRFGRHVAVLQDYGLWEFTLRVRLDR